MIDSMFDSVEKSIDILNELHELLFNDSAAVQSVNVLQNAGMFADMALCAAMTAYQLLREGRIPEERRAWLVELLNSTSKGIDAGQLNAE